MLAAALLVLPTLLSPQIEGLKPGESFARLAATPASSATTPPDHAFMSGRVLDACTGRPVASARVEVWTEEIDRSFGGFHRIGVVRCGTDGRFRVQSSEGHTRGEKARISASGYLTLSCVVGDLFETVRLFPAPKDVPRIRVLDLRGRPVAGALITSTYSCAHDLPALHVSTGIDGCASLEGFGVQDETPELRVRADGFAPIKYLSADEHLLSPRWRETLDVFVRRTTPVAFRLIGPEEAPLAHRPIYVTEGDFYHVARSDKEGLVRITNRHGWRDFYVDFLWDDRDRHVGLFVPPLGRVPALRPRSNDWDDDVETGRIRIEGLPGEDEPRVTLQLLHEKGWAVEPRNGGYEDTRFPVGRGYLVVGAPFSGVKQEILDFELRGGEPLVLRPKLIPEPTVRFEPELEDWKLTVEAGQHSREGMPMGENVHVPAHEELFLCLRGQGRTLRTRILPLNEGATVDLRKEFELDAENREPKIPQCTERLRFVSSAGGLLRGKVALVPGSPCTCTAKQDGTFEIAGPRGSGWIASFRAEGHVDVYVRGRMTENSDPIERVVPEYASLDIRAPFEFEIEDSEILGDLKHLAPGPLQLVLRTTKGLRYGLSLELRPGEARTIDVGR